MHSPCTRGIQSPRLELTHISLDGALEETHAERFRSAERLVILPAIMLHAIARNHGARSIRTALAVHKNRAGAAVFQKREHLHHLLIRRSFHTIHGDGYV